MQMMESNLWNGECRAPLLLKNIKTYASIAVNVWVEDFSPKRNLDTTT